MSKNNLSATFDIKQILLVVGLINLIDYANAQPLQVRVDRWLAVSKFSGSVMYSNSRTSQPIKLGDRLGAVGDNIQTNSNASATLTVDTGIGYINVAPNTKVAVQKLQVLNNGGHVTYLQVSKGQVRLKVRKFTNPASSLKIISPAGISSVRGTEFVVRVHPSGKNTLATLKGSVISSAQQKSVAVNAGWQNFTIPGKPPSNPEPIRNDTSLQSQIKKMLDGDLRKVSLSGRVDRANQVTVNNIEQVIDRSGRFNTILLPAENYGKIEVIVTTPLGKQQVYQLQVP